MVWAKSVDKWGRDRWDMEGVKITLISSGPDGPWYWIHGASLAEALPAEMKYAADGYNQTLPGAKRVAEKMIKHLANL